MKTRMVMEREGENMGPVDWSHPTAKDMPAIWREAEKDPSAFQFAGDFYRHDIYAICMYDGWPYWTPTPAIHHAGPIGAEWSFFNSYSVHPGSIVRRVPPLISDRHPAPVDEEETARAYAAGDVDTGAGVGVEERTGKAE